MVKNAIFRQVWVLVSLSFLSFAVAPGSTSAADAVTAANGPVERTLASGARALLWPRPGSGTVLVAVAVPAGSQDEPAEMAGLSHYLEHLLFDGFDDLDERDVTEAFEELSAYMNAFTREQATVYFALVPKEDAEAAAELMAGMLTRSTIGPEVYEKEKKVILEELAKDHASPRGLEEERLREVLWADTPLEHPVGGSMASVGATTREEVIRYWKERYVPAGFRILITGDRSLVDLENVLAPFAAAFTVAEPPPRPDPLSWPGWGTWAAAQPPDRPSAEGGMSGMGMGGGMPHGMGSGRPAPSGGTLAVVVAAPDSLATSGTELEVLCRWLSDPTGPLGSLTDSGLAADLSVTRLPRTPRDMVEVRVKAAVGTDPAGLLGQVLGGLREAAVGPDDARTDSIQRAWAGERALNDQRLHYAAVFYGEALAAARGNLAESVAPSPVSGTAVRSAASALLTDSKKRTRAAWLGPMGPGDRSPLPDAAAVPKIEDSAEFVDGPLGSVVTTLDNGLVVGVLPEEGSDVFGIHLLVADRSLREPVSAAGAADLLHRLLTGGTVLGGSHELADRIQRSGWDVKPADAPAIPFDNRYHVPDFSYVRLEGPGRDLEAALAMLAEMVRVPAWDEQGWVSALAEHRAAREADNRGGERAEQLFLGTLLGTDHPLARPVSGPAAGPLAGAEVIRDFWGAWPQGYFAPPRLVLTVASPVDAARTLELVRDFFSGGPASDPVRGPYPAPQPALEPPTVEVGDAPQVTVFWGRIDDVAEADRAAVLVAMDALSDRMTAVIREREGLAYRLGAGVRYVPGGSWVLSATVGTRPENSDRVQQLLAELVAGLAAEPLPAEEVARLNARERRSRMLRGLSAASRAYRVGRAIFEGPGSPLAVDEAAYAQVTPEQLRAAVANYLVADDVVTVVTP